MNANILPALPYPDFPLRPHRNGSWYRSVWNPRTKKSEQFYFGSWKDDSKGERALKDPEIVWLARKDAIKASVDNIRVAPIASVVTLGELMARFLAHKLGASRSGDLNYQIYHAPEAKYQTLTGTYGVPPQNIYVTPRETESTVPSAVDLQQLNSAELKPAAA